LEWNFLYFALTNIAFLANIFRWFVAKKGLKLVPFYGVPGIVVIALFEGKKPGPKKKN
jgi:hypothetical protein